MVLVILLGALTASGRKIKHRLSEIQAIEEPEEDEMKFDFDLLDATKIIPEEVLPLAPHPARRTTLCNKAPMRIACRILFFILEISFSFDFRSNVRARYLYYKRKVGKKKRTSFCVRCSLPSESELPECVLIAVLRDPWAILRLFRGCVL